MKSSRLWDGASIGHAAIPPGPRLPLYPAQGRNSVWSSTGSPPKTPGRPLARHRSTAASQPARARPPSWSCRPIRNRAWNGRRCRHRSVRSCQNLQNSRFRPGGSVTLTLSGWTRPCLVVICQLQLKY